MGYGLRDAPDDLGILLYQVIPAHARLAGQSGGDHVHTRPRRLLVVLGSRDHCIEAFDRRRLPLVESLSLGHPLQDVDDHDFSCEFALRYPLCRRCPDVPGSYYGYLVHGDRP